MTRRSEREYAARALGQRKARLARLLRLDAPDIIIYGAMRLVMKSQRYAHGSRTWHGDTWLRRRRMDLHIFLDRLFPSRIEGIMGKHENDADIYAMVMGESTTSHADAAKIAHSIMDKFMSEDSLIAARGGHHLSDCAIHNEPASPCDCYNREVVR